jgi:hypothetical protein
MRSFMSAVVSSRFRRMTDCKLPGTATLDTGTRAASCCCASIVDVYFRVLIISAGGWPEIFFPSCFPTTRKCTAMLHT